MKKQLWMLLMPLIGIAAALHVSEKTKEVKAEEVKETIPGYATSLVGSMSKPNYFDLESTINANYIDNIDELEVYDYNTDLMDIVIDYARSNNKTVASESLVMSTDKNNVTRKPMNKSAYWNTTDGTEANMPTRWSFFTQKSAVSLGFEDWNDKEQPLEFKISLGSQDWLETLLDFLCKYGPEEMSFPVISVDGQAILTANKSGTKMTLTTNNARVYPLYYEDSLHNTINFYSDVLVEIPFRNYIESIRSLYVVNWTDEDIYEAEPQVMMICQPVQFQKNTYDNSFFSPIKLANIDFKTGILDVVSPVSGNKYILDSITINNELEVKTTIQNIKVGNYEIPRNSSLYKKTQQYSMTLNDQPFNYNNSNIDFFNELKNSTEDVLFNITSYKFHLTLGRIEDTAVYDVLPPERIEAIENALDPTSILEMNSNLDLVRIPPRLRNASPAAADTTSEQLKDIIVDCGKYYVFKYNADIKIHTLNFNGGQANNSKYARLFFNLEDSTIGMDVEKIKGIMFYYQISKKNYSLSIVSEDYKDIGGEGWFFFGVAKENQVSKKDEFGNEFVLRPCNFWEGIGLGIAHWDTLGELNKNPDAGIFIITTENKSIIFKSVISAIYVDGKGDIINMSAAKDLFGEGYTGFIKDTGEIVIRDINGIERPGYYYDEETGILKDPFGGEVWGAPVVQDGDWLKKLLKILLFVGGVAAIVWIFSKVGPTIATLINGRRKKNE